MPSLLNNEWFVYIVECADTTFYTGIAKDVTQRLYHHNATMRGAKYTRCRRPVKLVYQEGPFLTKGSALIREYQIKSLTRLDKICLITEHVLKDAI